MTKKLQQGEVSKWHLIQLSFGNKMTYFQLGFQYPILSKKILKREIVRIGYK
jgi:hypothetical protein